jgi:hypothetical protein
MVEGFNQDVMKGFEALQALSEHAPIPSLATTAKDLHERLAKTGRGGPIVAFIATRGESVAPYDVVEAMNRFLEEAKKL